MVLVGSDAGSVGETHHYRHLGVAPGAEPISAQMTDDLIEGRVHEAVELDLGHGPGPGQRHSHCGPDDARLVQWGVDHPTLAKPLLEALGHPEDPAGQADVLAEDDDLRVALHRLVECRIDRLGHGHRPGRPLGNGIPPDRPDLVGVEMSRRLVMGALHGMELFHDMGRNPVKAVSDGIVPPWKWLCFDLGDGGGDQVGGLHRHLLLHRVVPLATFLEEPAQSVDRIPLAPRLLLFPGSVEGGIVGGGVGAVSVGHRLDQARTIAIPCPGDGLSSRQIYGDHVHPVHPDPSNPYAPAFWAMVSEAVCFS